MYGIRSKTAKFAIPAAIAIAFAAFSAPATADGKYYGGHAKYGHGKQFHGKKFKRAYRKGYRQGYRKGFKNGAKYGYGYAPKKYGKPGPKYGYKPSPKYGYKPGYKFGYGYGPKHKYWKKHGRHGVSVKIWAPLTPPPAYQPYRVKAACHPVVGKGTDHFGRRAKFGGTMCYDRYGNGYVVAGSRYVIRYY